MSEFGNVNIYKDEMKITAKSEYEAKKDDDYKRYPTPKENNGRVYTNLSTLKNLKSLKA